MWEIFKEDLIWKSQGLMKIYRAIKQILSYIKHEVEERYRNDLEHELKIQNMLRQTIQRAHDLNDFGTVETLEEI